jgi:hypothetical protein
VNAKLVEEIANAVLYEGYILYPYRPSAPKNRQRFSFGIVAPRADGDADASGSTSVLQTECLARSGGQAELRVRVRFLHLIARSLEQRAPAAGATLDSWQEAAECDVHLAVRVDEAGAEGTKQAFQFPPTCERTPSDDGNGCVIRAQEELSGELQVSIERCDVALLKVSVRVANTTPRSPSSGGDRDGCLMQSLVSTHAILQIAGGEFVSLLDPPDAARVLAASCRQAGLWPVLVGEPHDRDAVLASPIILYDYPEIAPESAGDFCDGTEIDEMLALRVLTMTDAEKREMRLGDPRARRMLERTESLSDDEMMKLHGVLRGLRHVASVRTP